MEYSNDLNLNNLEISSNKNIESEEPVEIKRTEEESNVQTKERSDQPFGIDQWLSMKEQLDQNTIEDISNHSSISSEHSSIASRYDIYMIV